MNGRLAIVTRMLVAPVWVIAVLGFFVFELLMLVVAVPFMFVGRRIGTAKPAADGIPAHALSVTRRAG